MASNNIREWCVLDNNDYKAASITWCKHQWRVGENKMTYFQLAVSKNMRNRSELKREGGSIKSVTFESQNYLKYKGFNLD